MFTWESWKFTYQIHFLYPKTCRLTIAPESRTVSPDKRHTAANHHNNAILHNNRRLTFTSSVMFLSSAKMDDNVLPQSTVCAKIMELLGQNKVDHRQRKVAIVSQDCFYKVLTPEQKAKALKGQYNFDHPGNLHLQTWSFFLASISLSHDHTNH